MTFKAVALVLLASLLSGSLADAKPKEKPPPPKQSTQAGDRKPIALPSSGIASAAPKPAVSKPAPAPASAGTKGLSQAQKECRAHFRCSLNPNDPPCPRCVGK